MQLYKHPSKSTKSQGTIFQLRWSIGQALESIMGLAAGSPARWELDGLNWHRFFQKKMTFWMAKNTSHSTWDVLIYVFKYIYIYFFLYIHIFDWLYYEYLNVWLNNSLMTNPGNCGSIGYKLAMSISHALRYLKWSTRFQWQLFTQGSKT